MPSPHADGLHEQRKTRRARRLAPGLVVSELFLVHGDAGRMKYVRICTLQLVQILGNGKAVYFKGENDRKRIAAGPLVDFSRQRCACQGHVAGRQAGGAGAKRKRLLRPVTGDVCRRFVGIGHGMVAGFSGNRNIVAATGPGRCRRKPAAGQECDDRSGPQSLRRQRRKPHELVQKPEFNRNSKKAKCNGKYG